MKVVASPNLAAATDNRAQAPTAASIARRNALVVEAIPLAKLIVGTYCRDHGIFGLREEIEAEALAGLLNLADTYRPASPWLKYVNRNLKFRLIDAMRRRSGRPSGKNYERRSNINDADVLDLRLEAIGRGDPAFAEIETADAFAYATRRMPAAHEVDHLAAHGRREDGRDRRRARDLRVASQPDPVRDPPRAGASVGGSVRTPTPATCRCCAVRGS